MQDQDVEALVNHLGQHPDVSESYVLVREAKVWCKSKGGHPYELGIKVFRSNSTYEPYTFETSHYAHTPTQIGRYITSANSAPSELEAVDAAIRTVAPWVNGAIEQGHTFDHSWLVPNESF